MPPLLKPVFCLFLATVWNATTRASDHFDENSFLEPLPLVLSVSRMPASREGTPAAITVLDRELIQAAGYREFSRLLRLVPGMQIGQERGNSHWVTYHGLGKDYPNQLQLLVDGLAIAPPGVSSFLNVLPQPVPMMNIERIEVLRGSDFSTYGSGGFLGLINIVTRPAAEHPEVSVRVAGGSPSLADVTASASLPLETGFLRMSAQTLNDDGFKGLRDGQQVRSINLHYDQAHNRASGLSAQFWHTEAKRGLGYEGTLFNNNGVRDERQKLGGVRLGWTVDTEPGHLLRLSLHHGSRTNIDRWTVSGSIPPLPPETVQVNNDSRLEWTSFELQQVRPLSSAVTLAWGGELGRDTLKSKAFFHDDARQKRGLGRLFANFEWRLNQELTLNASTMVERFSGQSPNAAPRLFLLWHETPGRTWRAGYTRAYHQPSVFEQRTDIRILAADGRDLQLRQVPNPDIRAQRMDVFELGAFGDWANGGHYDVRLFHERVNRLIRRTPWTAASANPHIPYFAVIQGLFGSSRWGNSPHTLKMTGLEYELSSPRMGQARLLFTHSMIHTQHPDRHLRRSVAPWTASLTWLHDWGTWQSSASLTGRGRMDASTGFVPGHRTSVPSFHQLDVSVWRTVRIGTQPAELRITGQNLLGRRQEVVNAPLQRFNPDRQPNRSSAIIYMSLQTGF